MRPFVLEFTKMSGAGNDFVVLDNRFFQFSEATLARLAARLCPRHEAVGADGLLALDHGSDGANFRMHYHNADGSRATMCGNGARCLARFARLAGLDRDVLAFDTDAGRYTADVPADPSAPVRLHVPPPRDLRPVRFADADLHAVWTGTEHVVAFADDVAALDLDAFALPVRHDPALAPRGANVNAVQVLEAGRAGAPARLRVRTFEKGVEGETRACGTGAMASALVAVLTGRVAAAPVAVEMPGGTLTVGFEGEAGAPAKAVRALTLAGPAVVTFRGSVDLDPALLA